MKNLIYKAGKIAIGVILSILISDLIGLNYSSTAGIVCMTGSLDTRMQTYIVSLKRLLTALIATILSAILFSLFGHKLIILGLFLFIFIPLVTALNISEGLVISTVLVSRIYNLKMLNFKIVSNEIGLLLVGMLIACLMTIHAPNREKEIRKIQLEVEDYIKNILKNMSLQLFNQCSIEDNLENFKILDDQIKNGLNRAIEYNNNIILKDNSYFIKYFQMRRAQFDILSHMQKHFEFHFVDQKNAKLLSDFTKELADSLNECNDCDELFKKVTELKKYYNKEVLPSDRQEFENRATLYQYFNDLVYFIEIKSKFIKDNGDFKYCMI
ncbi:aromatic acid exporter family protein [Peptostreptococcaceae bacterium AGR-M142]